MTELEELRASLNQKWGATRGKLTLLPLLARAMVVALRDFRRSMRATTTRPAWSRATARSTSASPRKATAD